MVILQNPIKVLGLIDDFMLWLNTTHEHPVTVAALAHYKLVSIHPFVDENGRTARLLMNLILIQNGYPPAIITQKDRLKYLNSLEKAQLGGAIADYLQLIYSAVIRSLTIYLKALSQEAALSKSNVSTLLKIGALVKVVTESTSTLRHRTKTDLLEVATTTPSGYHLYPYDMIERCKQIRELQHQRYTLEEIL